MEINKSLKKNPVESDMLFGREMPIWLPFQNISNWFLHTWDFDYSHNQEQQNDKYEPGKDRKTES